MTTKKTIIVKKNTLVKPQVITGDSENEKINESSEEDEVIIEPIKKKEITEKQRASLVRAQEARLKKYRERKEKENELIRQEEAVNREIHENPQPVVLKRPKTEKEKKQPKVVYVESSSESEEEEEV